jgi:hypothetical protein
MIDYYSSIVTGNCNTILILSFLYTNMSNCTPLKSNIGGIGFELTTDSSFNFDHLYRGMYTHNSGNRRYEK